jgi:hypothetical protein
MSLNHRHKGVETNRRLWEGRLVLVVNVDGLLYERTALESAQNVPDCFVLLSNIAVLKLTFFFNRNGIPLAAISCQAFDDNV